MGGMGNWNNLLALTLKKFLYSGSSNYKILPDRDYNVFNQTLWLIRL